MGVKEDVRGSYTDSFKHRMRNWARHVSGSSLGYAAINWDSVGSQSDGSPLPILTGEAEDTGKALATLAIRYRRAVELYWLWGDEDAELSVLGRQCAVDYRTFGHRVIDGHRLLQAELACAAEAWRAHRERTEVVVSAKKIAGVHLTGTILQV